MRICPYQLAEEPVVNPWQNLQRETTRFRSWAQVYPEADRSGEWECDYESWTDLYEAFQDFLETRLPDTWTNEQETTLLYVLARDNETGTLAREVARDSKRLCCLATASLTSTEPNAKWQLAVELGNRREFISKAESLLVVLVEDEDEYVRRRALMALGQIRSSLVDKLVAGAWNRQDEWQEYQRMTVLSALYDTGSSQLARYLAKADVDGRQYLTDYAAKIRGKSRDKEPESKH